MILRKLNLKNFRNYDELEIEFNSKLNIIIGNNAQGKTNILESIYTLALTKSFLPVVDKNLIKYNKLFLSIKGNVIKDCFNKKLELIINDNGKKLKVNDKDINKFSEYLTNLHVIIFSPDDIRMIKEGPFARRKYLNIELSQLDSNYIQLLNNFNKVLRQRNEYLKLIGNYNNYDSVYFQILTNNYAQLAVEIYLYRKNYIDLINNSIGKIYKNIANQKSLQLNYISNINYFDNKEEMVNNLIKKLIGSLEREKKYKMTLLGPHRDDFYFYLDDKNISLFGSQGQIRMSMLSLKISEISIFRKKLNDNPILLLDDIFSELDIHKRNKLIKYLNIDIQTIITTTDINMIDSNLVKNANIYKIKNGKIVSSKTRRE